jgi:hypothetical protein
LCQPVDFLIGVPPGRKKYLIEYIDENGDRRRKTGSTDKGVTERLARDIERWQP